MIIIKPTVEEIPQLLELWKQQYSYHHDLDSVYYVSNSAELPNKFQRYVVKAITKDKPNILVVKEGNEIIGFITFEINDEPYFDTNIKEFGVVIELFVKEEARRKGIGKKLMQRAENYFTRKGLNFMKIQCSTPNKQALNFYEKAGYINRQALLYKKLK